MKRTTFTVAAAMLAASTLACETAPAEIRIGGILSLTGSGAPYGNSIKNGVDLALDEINAAGGVSIEGADSLPVTFIFRDARSDPRVGVEAAQELLATGMVAVIGADVSDVTLAMAPVFQEARVVLLSPSSSSPKLTTAGEYIFRNFPSDELEALNTADYIFNKVGLREAAVIANQNEFGIGTKNAFIERFRMLGGRVTAQTTYPLDASDLSAQASEIMQADPPAIYIAGYSADTALVVSALRAAGEDAALFGTGAVLPEEIVSLAGADSEGLVFPNASFDSTGDNPAVLSFVVAYEGKYGQPPDTYAAHGYDAMMILAQAIQESGIAPDDVRFYLNSMNPYEGVSGDTDFNDDGDVRKFHTMWQIADGRGRPVEQPAGGSDQ